MRAIACRYRRDRGSDWEPGIAIEVSEGGKPPKIITIIPATAKGQQDYADNVWVFNLDPFKGCFELPGSAS